MHPRLFYRDRVPANEQEAQILATVMRASDTAPQGSVDGCIPPRPCEPYFEAPTITVDNGLPSGPTRRATAAQSPPPWVILRSSTFSP